MQLVNINDIEAYSVSDQQAREWMLEARREELRQRSGYYTATAQERLGTGVAGCWAETDESRIGSDEPVEALAYLDRKESPVVVRPGEGFEDELVDEDERNSWLEDDRTLAQDRAMLAWLSRDEREMQREQRERRRTGADRFLEANGEVVRKPRVVGDYWGAGPEAEKIWLDAQIAQLRIEYAEVVRGAMKAHGWSAERARRVAQAQAIVRQAESLRHRHNFKRYVEALYCDSSEGGADFGARYQAVNSKRKAARMSYDKAVKALAGVVEQRNAEALMGVREWVGVEGLIAA